MARKKKVEPVVEDTVEVVEDTKVEPVVEVEKTDTEEVVESKEDTDTKESTDLSGHDIDSSFLNLLSQDRSLPSTALANAGFLLIEQLRLEVLKEEDNKAVPAFVKNVSILIGGGRLNEKMLGLPTFNWTKGSESMNAYDTTIAVAIAIASGDLENLSKENVLASYTGDYAIIGEKVISNYFD